MSLPADWGSNDSTSTTSPDCDRPAHVRTSRAAPIVPCATLLSVLATRTPRQLSRPWARALGGRNTHLVVKMNEPLWHVTRT